MKTYEAESYWVKIYIAGPIDKIEQVCRDYVTCGACVSVKQTKYIYTYGEETGAEIVLINYPKYPSSPANLWDSARELAHQIMKDCHQGSYTVMDRMNSYTYDRRDETVNK